VHADLPGESAPSTAPGPATRLLRELAAGRAGAADELMPLVYDELRALAGAFFRRESATHTLQPTALVHEAWLRLVSSQEPDYASRTHFLAIAATTMRRLLVEHARARDASKRGGEWTRITLDPETRPSGAGEEVDILALHEALEHLATLSPRQAHIVELRWFGGLTVAEVAELLGVVPRTVESDWTMAKAWLRRRLG